MKPAWNDMFLSTGKAGIQFLRLVKINKNNKNQKWDPLRAMKTFIRRKMGHTT